MIYQGQTDPEVVIIPTACSKGVHSIIMAEYTIQEVCIYFIGCEYNYILSPQYQLELVQFAILLSFIIIDLICLVIILLMATVISLMFFFAMFFFGMLMQPQKYSRRQKDSRRPYAYVYAYYTD